MRKRQLIGLAVAAAALMSQLHVSVGRMPECTPLPALFTKQWLVQPAQATRRTLFIRPQSREDVAQLRNVVRKVFFGTDTLPSQSNVAVEVLTDPKTLKDAPPEAAAVSRAVIDMGLMKSDAFIFWPKTSNRQLIIYHAGHEGRLPQEFIGRLVAQGNTVVGMQMPLAADNAKYAPTVDVPRIGPMKLVTHSEFSIAENPTFQPLRYFVEPVIVIINYMLKTRRFDSVAMIGLSGGGWTTTIAAAIDPRITRSYDVAGTLPLYLRWTDWESWGDYEQVHPLLLREVGYLELYLLDATGRGRRHTQILNKYDSCCFSIPSVPAYVSVVEQRVAAIEPGKYSFALDDTHVGHKISRCTESRILADLSSPTR